MRAPLQARHSAVLSGIVGFGLALSLVAAGAASACEKHLRGHGPSGDTSSEAVQK